MDYSEIFRVKPGSKVKLGKIDPNFTAKHENKAAAQEELDKYTRKLRELQYLLYAEGKRSLLICLQALDAAGKDGTINHVLGNMNPRAPASTVSRSLPRRRRPTISSGAFTGRRPAKGEVVDLQPLALRRRAGRPRAQAGSQGGLVEALRPDQRVREEPGRQRHAHSQVLSAHQRGRATPALQAAARRSRTALEDQRERTTRNASSGTITRRRTKTRWARPARSTRRGSSFPPTTNGSATWPCREIVVETLESLR